jgi:hypothetical protein
MILRNILTAFRARTTSSSASETFLEYEVALNTISAAQKTAERLRVPMGQVLHAIRETENLSMRAAAERIGISGPHWSDLETGKRRITRRVLKKLRRVFNP